MTDKELLFEYVNSDSPRFMYEAFSDGETFALLSSETAEKELTTCFPYTRLKKDFQEATKNTKLDAIASGCIDIIIYLALELNEDANKIRKFLVKYLDPSFTSAALKEAIQILSNKHKDLIQKGWKAYQDYLRS